MALLHFLLQPQTTITLTKLVNSKQPDKGMSSTYTLDMKLAWISNTTCNYLNNSNIDEYNLPVSTNVFIQVDPCIRKIYIIQLQTKRIHQIHITLLS